MTATNISGRRPSVWTRLASRLRWEISRSQEQRGDRRLGIETLWERPKGALNPTDRNQPYEAVSYQGLRIISDHVKFGPSDRFYDVGCGAGRALCFFAQQPIQECVGIEFDPALSARCEANAVRMKGKRAPIRIETLSAEIADYTGCTIAFVYNSFGAEVLEGFLRRLEETASREKLLLIYANPVHAHIVDRHSWLRRVDWFDVPHLGSPIKAYVYARA